MMLSEFSSQLEQAAQLMRLKLYKKPRNVALWANRWAKHRLQILLQHHPLMAFGDQYGDSWDEAERRFRSEPLYDGCGNAQPVRIIDTEWLAKSHGKKIEPMANQSGRTIVLVPPLMVFLDETITFFRAFVDACLKNVDSIRRFESAGFTREAASLSKPTRERWRVSRFTYGGFRLFGESLFREIMNARIGKGDSTQGDYCGLCSTPIADAAPSAQGGGMRLSKLRLSQ